MKILDLLGLTELVEQFKQNFAKLVHTHKLEDITDYKVDSSLSETSTNPVQNKAVNQALVSFSIDIDNIEADIDSLNDNKANASDIPTKVSQLTNDSGYLTSNTTPVKSVNGKTGVVSLTASDVGADASGAASAVQSNLNVLNDEFDDHVDNVNIHFTADERTKLAGIATGANNYKHPNSGVTAGTYKSVTVNANGHVTGGSNPTTLSGYGITDAEAKGTVNTHNTSTSAHNDIRLLISDVSTKLNNFLNVSDTTKDQLSEIIALIEENADDIESITSGKVNVSDIVNNLTTNVDNKPLSASQGVEIKRLIDALQGGLDAHEANADIHFTTEERTKLSGIKEGAEVNQDAFSNVKVGETTITADSKTDVLEFVGNNVIITPDAENDKITFKVEVGTTNNFGIVKLTDSVESIDIGSAATPNSVKTAYDLANAAKTIADDVDDRLTVVEDTFMSEDELISYDFVSSELANSLGEDEAFLPGVIEDKIAGLESRIDATESHLTDTDNPHNIDTKISEALAGFSGGASTMGELTTVDTKGLLGTTGKTVNAQALNDTMAQKIIDLEATENHTHTVSQISDLIVSANELNNIYGVTSNVQSQLNEKAALSHGNHVPATETANNAKFLRNDNTWQTVTPANIGAAEVSHTHDYAASSHNHSAGEITSGTLSVSRGGTGVTSNPSMLTNLGTTTAASVFAASPRPGVTGTLPIENGGTGATTAAGVLTKLGITATAAELNYCDGVTSNIQTQLNNKVNTSALGDQVTFTLSGTTLTIKSK